MSKFFKQCDYYKVFPHNETQNTFYHPEKPIRLKEISHLRKLGELKNNGHECLVCKEHVCSCLWCQITHDFLKNDRRLVSTKPWKAPPVSQCPAPGCSSSQRATYEQHLQYSMFDTFQESYQRYTNDLNRRQLGPRKSVVWILKPTGNFRNSVTNFIPSVVGGSKVQMTSSSSSARQRLKKEYIEKYSKESKDYAKANVFVKCTKDYFNGRHRKLLDIMDSNEKTTSYWQKTDELAIETQSEIASARKEILNQIKDELIFTESELYELKITDAEEIFNDLKEHNPQNSSNNKNKFTSKDESVQNRSPSLYKNTSFVYPGKFLPTFEELKNEVYNTLSIPSMERIQLKTMLSGAPRLQPCCVETQTSKISIRTTTNSIEIQCNERYIDESIKAKEDFKVDQETSNEIEDVIKDEEKLNVIEYYTEDTKEFSNMEDNIKNSSLLKDKQNSPKEIIESSVVNDIPDITKPTVLKKSQVIEVEQNNASLEDLKLTNGAYERLLDPEWLKSIVANIKKANFKESEQSKVAKTCLVDSKSTREIQDRLKESNELKRIENKMEKGATLLNDFEDILKDLDTISKSQDEEQPVLKDFKPTKQNEDKWLQQIKEIETTLEVACRKNTGDFFKDQKPTKAIEDILKISEKFNDIEAHLKIPTKIPKTSKDTEKSLEGLEQSVVSMSFINCENCDTLETIKSGPGNDFDCKKKIIDVKENLQIEEYFTEIKTQRYPHEFRHELFKNNESFNNTIISKITTISDEQSTENNNNQDISIKLNEPCAALSKKSTDILLNNQSLIDGTENPFRITLGNKLDPAMLALSKDKSNEVKFKTKSEMSAFRKDIKKSSTKLKLKINKKHKSVNNMNKIIKNFTESKNKKKLETNKKFKSNVSNVRVQESDLLNGNSNLTRKNELLLIEDIGVASANSKSIQNTKEVDGLHTFSANRLLFIKDQKKSSLSQVEKERQVAGENLNANRSHDDVDIKSNDRLDLNTASTFENALRTTHKSSITIVSNKEFTISFHKPVKLATIQPQRSYHVLSSSSHRKFSTRCNF